MYYIQVERNNPNDTKVVNMKTIKTISGDGFRIYVSKGAESLYYVEMFKSESNTFDDDSCVVCDDYNSESEALTAATLLAVTQSTSESAESYLNSLGSLNPFL
jgi:hypothetical protein